ncbi:AAA family ATPase [Rhodococcus sp. 14-2483-1-1]|uniref:nSTAND1 domain-containing NTPase n=1 Tax=Rhodococcus sp. 14-2483-1-1 TaxID=2023148 RepID=UPI00148386C0|nr:AAA family ATPase [Rhodococcus sp. 14-2483-1-1]
MTTIGDDVDDSPSVSPRERFAVALAQLYFHAGEPPLKKVASSANAEQRRHSPGAPEITPQRISDWRRGRRLPARFAAVLPVLTVLIAESRKRTAGADVEPDLLDVERWRERWTKAMDSPVAKGASTSAEAADADPPEGVEDVVDAASVPVSSAPTESRACPYVGLASYTEDDTLYYFGRRRELDKLIDAVGEAHVAGGVVVLAAPSGAGKSSLLRAGLVGHATRTEAGRGLYAACSVLRPAADPFTSLVEAIPVLELLVERLKDVSVDDDVLASEIRDRIDDHLADRPPDDNRPGTRLLVVVDQYEDLFVAGADASDRLAFARTLHLLASGLWSRVSVVCGLRADFFGQCLESPYLADALQNRSVVLTPMTMAELRSAIVEPAKVVGARLEPGLLDVVIGDIGAQTAEHGSSSFLPLLSHVLQATWSRRTNGKLTLAGYRAVGGLQGSITRTAEDAWAGLDSEGKHVARQLLTRLVRIGDGVDDTRRRRPMSEFDGWGEGAVLQALVTSRLLTVTETEVELVHDVVLRAWPRLRRWIAEDRHNAIVRQRIEGDALAWEQSGRESALLASGSRLDAAQTWIGASRYHTELEVEFVEASSRRVRRAAILRRGVVVVIAVLSVAALTAAAVAADRSRQFERERDSAVFAGVIATAASLRDVDTSLAAQVSLIARNERPDDEQATTSVVATSDAPLAVSRGDHTGAIYFVDVSPDGRIAATAGYDGSVRLWDISTPYDPVRIGSPLLGHTGFVTSVDFDSTGKILVTASDDGTVRLWDVSDASAPSALGAPLQTDGTTVFTALFDPGRSRVAAVGESGSLWLWDVSNPLQPRLTAEFPTGHDRPIRAMAYSPDGRTVATGSDDATAILVDVTDFSRPVQRGPRLLGHTKTVHALAFSPDGSVLATGSDDTTARLWNVSDPAGASPIGAPVVGQTSPLWSVDFSRDGRRLATAGLDGATTIWNIDDPAVPTMVGPALTAGRTSVFSARFLGDGNEVLTGGADGSLRVWSLSDAVLPRSAGRALPPVFDESGTTMVTGAYEGAVQLWTLPTSSTTPAAVIEPIGGDGYRAIAITQDGRTLATATASGRVLLWRLEESNETPVLVSDSIVLNTQFMSNLEFVPSGRTLVTNGDDDTVRLWDVEDPARPRPWGEPIGTGGGWTTSIAVDPTGTALALARGDRSVTMWDISEPDEPVRGDSSITLPGTTETMDFGPDGVLAAGGSDGIVRLLDVSKPEPQVVGASQASIGSIRSVDFDADTRQLVASGDDRSVRLWRATDEQQLEQFGDPIDLAGSGRTYVAFEPRHNTVVAAPEAGNTIVYDVSATAQAERICQWTRSAWTPELWASVLPRLPYDPPC